MTALVRLWNSGIFLLPKLGTFCAGATELPLRLFGVAAPLNPDFWLPPAVLSMKLVPLALLGASQIGVTPIAIPQMAVMCVSGPNTYSGMLSSWPTSRMTRKPSW